MAKVKFGIYSIIIVIIISGTIQIYVSLPRSAFAQARDQKISSTQIKELEDKLKTVEKDYYELKKDIFSIKEDISNNKVESLASKKLLEVSEKNLTAPIWVTGVLIGLIVVVSSIISILIFILRRGILDKIDEEIKEINEARDLYIKDFNSQIDKINQTWESHKKESYEAWESHKQESNVIKRDVVKSLAFNFNVAMVDSWEAKRFDQAIKFGESAVKYAVEAFGEKSGNFDDQLVLERIRSNLAYVYAERNRTDKAPQAIEYAIKGLEIGRATGYLDLIDNFLFVIKVFSKNPKDRILWKEIYEEYKDEIYRSKIREGEEQDEFDKFYKELQHLTACKD